ncbi:hypothetical protein Dalk_0834 [Desulfatibacillum aliphaticivorans]|uniref:Uncharacterized protein n=2 Tax=Desulfatibacillum aliphaticivorans TaxID=218208 RepID=B8FHX2_DESAL|nr:hypothetical protein Dalk_0834 [Desulfatibacillum aliphaticivorans]
MRMRFAAWVCCLMCSLGFLIFPVAASAGGQEEVGLQVLDFPSEKVMVAFYEKHAPGASDAMASMNISGCGDFRLYKLVDYKDGADKTVSLPWGHRLADRKQWGVWEKWFRNSMKKRCDKSRRLPRDIPNAVWYSLSSEMSVKAAESQSVDDFKRMLDASEVPGITQYVIEQDKYRWWPPKAPDELPF